MKKFVRVICLWMAVLMTVMCYLPVSAKALETVPGETRPASVTNETGPGEPVPEQETIETVPAEVTVPAETVKQEVVELPSIDSLPLLPEPISYQEVPLYLQTDYPDNMYGSGTIANNGCSVTCLAMVASYLTEHEYLPDELARYFGGSAENNIARLEKGAE